MGSSETGGVTVDSGVGSIVWVRRRNGSWWPGKVLGPEDLSSSLLTSPRSGTPVKLLGREDACVDWYNLEKSKRVKSFRCGEFDNCIERVEAVQGMPPKKREKYARREDAILHALELERQLFEKKYGKFEFSLNGKGKTISSAVTLSEGLETSGRLQVSPCSNQISEANGSSTADENLTGNTEGDTVREGNQASGDDSTACVLPRMRGLQEFGLCTAPPSSEAPSQAGFHVKRRKYTYLTNDSGTCFVNSSIKPSETDIPVSMFQDNDSMYPTDLGKKPIFEPMEYTETDCSETDSLESDSDDYISALSDGSASIELQPKYPMRTEVHEERKSSHSDDLDGSTFSDESPHPFSNDLFSTGTEESKWQMKGKRKNLHLQRGSSYRTESESPRGYMSGRNSHRHNKGFKADSEKNSMTHLQDPCCNVSNLESLTWINPTAMRGYLNYSLECMDPLFVSTHHFGGRMILVDVDLKVQANNYRRDVSMISLTSQFNGHAVVGHPIQIEVLENGSSENLITRSSGFTKSLENPPVLPQVWRTGRRTANFRVPRPSMSGTLDGDSRQKSQLTDEIRKPSSRLDWGSFSQKANNSRNRLSQYPMDGELNQKIRTLSSIESDQKHHSNSTSGGANNEEDDFMKTEYLPTIVACIPVNLVFSRLHEELNGRHQ